jgi:hypothetical protein
VSCILDNSAKLSCDARLLEAFYTKKSVKVLKIMHDFCGLQGAELGNVLSLLLLNNTTVQRLECKACPTGCFGKASQATGGCLCSTGYYYYYYNSASRFHP